MEYLEAIESENSFDKKRRRRNTVKSIGDQSVESDLFDEYETTSSITDDGYEVFTFNQNIIIFKQFLGRK